MKTRIRGLLEKADLPKPRRARKARKAKKKAIRHRSEAAKLKSINLAWLGRRAARLAEIVARRAAVERGFSLDEICETMHLILSPQSCLDPRFF
jgi:hypothetical protein